jgi:hypothetical protein
MSWVSDFVTRAQVIADIAPTEVGNAGHHIISGEFNVDGGMGAR